MPNSRRTRFRRWVYRRIPRWMRDRDFEIFAAFLSFLGGLPLLFGQVDASSVEATLPGALVKGWALVLTLAPFLITTGIIKGHYSTYPRRAFWLRLEALGLTALAYASYVYATCIIAAAPGQGWPAAMIIICFGVTCHSRELGIQLELVSFRRGMGLDDRI